MEELSEIPGKTRGAGVSALVGHLFNAQMEIGEKKLSFFQANLTEARAESFACLLPKEVLKTRAAEADLRSKLPDPPSVRAVTLHHSKSADNSRVHDCQ
jgi:hypothetical protein